MRKRGILLIILIIITGILYYQLVESYSTTKHTAKIQRILDGDTIEIENNQKIRLLGINTPETGEFESENAKLFMQQFQNKTIIYETQSRDQYGRILAYVYYNNQLINKQILENGLAHLYYYEKDKYYNELKLAEEKARNSQIGIWTPSKTNSNCLILVQLKYEEQTRCKNQEQLIIYNNCEEIQATIKDNTASHIYKETIPAGTFTKNFSCIFNDEGDSLFVWDKEGLLLFYRY